MSATQVISEARLAANRANGQKSTGPRTAAGKAAVSNNALKHGLRSERNPMDLAADAALPYEQTQFLETLAAFKEDLGPEGILETRLADRLAQLDHRLQRAVRMDTAHLEMQATLIYRSSPESLPKDEQTRNNWLSALSFLKNPSASTLLAQYESRLARDFARTLTQLRQAQKLRNQTQLPSATISTRSVASNGHIASPSPNGIPAEQTQPQTLPATDPTPPPIVDQADIGDGEQQTQTTAPPSAKPIEISCEQTHRIAQRQQKKADLLAREAA